MINLHEMEIDQLEYALKCMKEDYDEMEDGEQKSSLWEEIHSLEETINEKR